MRPPFRRPAARGSTAPDRRDPSVWASVRFLLLVLLAAWAFRSFLFTPFNIPSGSMLPTLRIGDYILVAKWPYGYSRYSFPFGVPSFEGRIFGDLPKRGDIVVFRAPTGGHDVVKRVVGLPGDTIAVRGGMLVLNDRPIPRMPKGMVGIDITPNSPCRVTAGATPQYAAGGSRCLYPAYSETLPGGGSNLVIDQVETSPGDEFPSLHVPPGHVFLMGDNRDDSLDSRFPQEVQGLGFVPVENLIGKAVMIVWSTDGSAHYLKPWTWFTALRGDRIGISNFGEPAR